MFEGLNACFIGNHSTFCVGESVTKGVVEAWFGFFFCKCLELLWCWCMVELWWGCFYFPVQVLCLVTTHVHLFWLCYNFGCHP